MPQDLSLSLISFNTAGLTSPNFSKCTLERLTWAILVTYDACDQVDILAVALHRQPFFYIASYAFLLVGGITGGVLFGSTHGWFAGSDETYEYHGNIFTAPQDELPLTVEDLVDVNYDGYMREQTNHQSLLLAQYEACQRPRFDAADFREMPTLEYTVTVVKAPFLYDMCRDHLLLDRAERWNQDMPESAWYSYEPTDPAPWGAEAAYCWTSREYGQRNTFSAYKYVLKVDNISDILCSYQFDMGGGVCGF